MKLTPINPHFNACDQKWELMPEQEHGGRLCEACERVLVDFTQLSEQQILNQQRENNYKLCGRYTRSQVDRLPRHLAIEESKDRKPWLVAMAMAAIGLVPAIAMAQDTSRVHIPVDYTVPLPGVPGQMQYPLLAQTVDSLILHGTVVKQTGEPIPFADIVIIGDDNAMIRCTTDANGSYSAAVPVANIRPNNGKREILITLYLYDQQQYSTVIDDGGNQFAIDLLLDITIYFIVPAPITEVGMISLPRVYRQTDYPSHTTIWYDPFTWSWP